MKKRHLWFCMLLVTLCLVCLPVQAEVEIDSFTYVNPAYADLVAEWQSDTVVSPYAMPTAVEERVTYLSSAEEAALVLRQALVNREESITIGFRSSVKPTNENMVPIFEKVYDKAVEHTGVPYEGDYIDHHIAQIYLSCAGAWDGHTGYYAYTIEPLYMANAEQEEELNTKLAEVMAMLDLDGKTEYEKIHDIYQYICDHVTYDHDNLEDTTYLLKHSAYAALVEGTAVCQGYATLFYRMALEAGLDARYIFGVSFNEPHGWNIVRIDDLYYNLDSTWGAELSTWEYFLLNAENFDKTHVRDASLNTDAFHKQYPMSKADYVPPYWQGRCGENVNWKLTKEGELYITGTGATYAYGSYNSDEGGISSAIVERPWTGLAPVRKIYVDKGVTQLTCGFFASMDDLEEVIFHEDSITSVPACLFQGSTLHGDLLLPPSVKTVENGAFWQATIWGQLTIPEDLSAIGDHAFREAQGFQGGITIPDTVLKIGPYTFEKAIIAGPIHFGKNIQTIGDHAFYYCSFTGDLILPDTLTTIGKCGFAGVCPNGKLVFGKNVSAIGELAFSNTIFQSDLVIPTKVTTIGKGTFQHSTFGGKLVLHDNLVQIGTYAFVGSTFRSDLVIPDSVKTIDSVFMYASFGGTLTLGKGLTDIPVNAFNGCDFTGTLYIPDTIYTIGNHAFQGNHFEKVYIGENVETIPEYAFAHSPFLREVYFPEYCFTLEQFCFRNCLSLQAAFFVGDAPAIDRNSFVYKPGESSTYTKLPHLTLYSQLKIYDWEVLSFSGYKVVYQNNAVTVPVASIVLHDEAEITITIGNTRTLRHSLFPAHATNKTVFWKSSNPNIASVDTNGKITARQLGTAVITATTVDGGFSLSRTVHVVTEKPMTHLALEKAQVRLDIGQTLPLVVSYLPQDADCLLTWTSDNPAIATVLDGVVTAVDYGTTIIRATSKDGSLHTACTVVVAEQSYRDIPVTSATFQEYQLQCTVGTTATLKMNLTPEDATDKTVRYLNSDPTVAIVENGFVRAISPGITTVTGISSQQGIYASCTIEVLPAKIDKVTSIKLPSTKEMETGDTLKLKAQLRPTDTSYKDIIWISANPAIATVENGLVRALTPGTVEITAMSAWGQHKSTCTVTVKQGIVPVTQVTLNQTEATLHVGETLTLTPTVSPANATNQAITWTSDNPAVATVVDGIITAHTAGTATITVTTVDSSYTAECVVTVQEAEFTSIVAVSPDHVQLYLENDTAGTCIVGIYTPDGKLLTIGTAKVKEKAGETVIEYPAFDSERYVMKVFMVNDIFVPLYTAVKKEVLG